MRLAEMVRMGMFSKAPSAGDGDGVTPLDVIFSCSLCFATFSEVYKDHHDTVQGLSDGINPKNRLVTKLFVTSCCHVICSKHLEGGGPPFHPAGTRPRAPCPVCAKEKGEDQPRDLFSIRGFKEGEYDSGIPACWFVTPPIKLDSAGKEMEALKFQYIALLRYTTQLTTQHMHARENLAETQNDLRTVQTLGAEEHAKVLALEREIERLRPLEAKLQKLMVRMPAIEHYLKVIPKLTEQNGQMRDRLASLGFQMPLEPLSYKEPFPFDEDDDHMSDYSAQPSKSPKQATSSHTAGRSAETPGQARARPLKRQRVDDSPLHGKNIHAPPPGSRDMMPPPTKPLSRMRSVKRFFPTLRKKHSISRASPALSGDRIPEADVQMYENAHWEDANRLDEHTNGYDRPTRHGVRGDTPYMTGALPAGHSPNRTNSPPPQLLPSVGAREERGEFTFRVPSPVKATGNQTGGLPTERSYIRLMDGLSQDTGLELELQDPRYGAPSSYQSERQKGLHQDSPLSPVRRRETDDPNRWSLGHAFLHQSPNGASSSAYRHPDPLRSNPTDDHISKRSDERTMNPTTPAPQRFQQPAPLMESVVSPFFKSSHHNSQSFSRARVAEREDSSRHSDVYQCQGPKAITTQTDWHEPRSLNGLSFFNSPLNTKNEPIGYNSGYVQSGYMASPPRRQQYQSRNINSRGFITRPNTGRSPFLDNSAYGSSLDHTPNFRQTQTPTQSAIPFSSFSRRPHSRAAPLPSAMPSIISSQRSPLRSSQSQWNNTASAGPRSSRRWKTRASGDAFASSPRNIFSSAGRRAVRR